MDIELAKRLLQEGKRLAPDRFPQPSLDVAKSWQRVLSQVDFPPRLWGEAVDLWATTLVGERMCTPRDLIQAAYVVRDRWESVPETAQVLDELRAARANRNYARAGLEPITVADLPRHAGKPPEAVRELPHRQDTPPERMGETNTFPFKRKSEI